jgi:hypothetical protein
MQAGCTLSNIATVPEIETLIGSVILKENQDIQIPRNYYAKYKDS